MIKDYMNILWLIIGLLYSQLAYSQAQVPSLAFDGAVGFGKYSLGGKGGMVYIISTLADNVDNPQPGSLRFALKQNHPRILVFSVSGVIHLKAPISVKNGYLTIAGQSSPGGVTIAGAPISINRAEHIIIQYMRFRLGTFGFAEDALTIRNSEHVIVDHCSFSWSVDETATFYNNTNFTLQHSIIAWSLNDSIHPKGKHGYGGIWGGRNASFINNVIAHHSSRTPRINGHRLNAPYQQNEEFIEIANNVIYNWGSNNVYGSENGRFNLINNYYKSGPNSKVKQFLDLWYSDSMTSDQTYVAGNIYHQDDTLSSDNTTGIMIRQKPSAKKQHIASSHPLLAQQRIITSAVSPINYYQPSSAQAAFNELITLRNVGANRNATGTFLDSIDSQVLDQIAGRKTELKTGIIDHENELISAWQAYHKQFSEFPKIVDKNRDGIADQWAKNNPQHATQIMQYLAFLSAQ